NFEPKFYADKSGQKQSKQTLSSALQIVPHKAKVRDNTLNLNKLKRLVHVPPLPQIRLKISRLQD
ncbi:hypothetical protein EZS27_021738, partial [termite gut metagenome]